MLLNWITLWSLGYSHLAEIFTRNIENEIGLKAQWWEREVGGKGAALAVVLKPKRLPRDFAGSEFKGTSCVKPCTYCNIFNKSITFWQGSVTASQILVITSPLLCFKCWKSPQKQAGKERSWWKTKGEILALRPGRGNDEVATEEILLSGAQLHFPSWPNPSVTCELERSLPLLFSFLIPLLMRGRNHNTHRVLLVP